MQTKRGRKKTTDDATGTTVGGIRAATGIPCRRSSRVVEPAEEDKTRAHRRDIYTFFGCWTHRLFQIVESSFVKRTRAREISISIVPAGRHRSTQSRDDSPALRRSSRHVSFYVRVFLRGCLKNPRQHASSSCERTTKRRWRLATVDEYALVVDAWDNDAGIVVRECGRPDRTRSNRTNRSNR